MNLFRSGSNLTILVAVAAFCVSCINRPPRVELVSYISAYSETHKITNDILNIVIPYERIVIRYAAERRTRTISSAQVDPTCVPELQENGCKKRKTYKTEIVVLESTCLNGYRGPDQFCYELRDGFADIGDPPLVGAYRNLSKTIARFNAILAAYADGVSIKFIQQELSILSSDIVELGKNPYFSTSSAEAWIGDFVKNFLPLAKLALDVRDRAQLKEFLVDNYKIVDFAMENMVVNSPALYANVAVGTNLYNGAPSTVDIRSMKKRRKAIRKIVANWTVVLDDSRQLLSALKFAIDNPNNLEVRLRNLDEPSVTVRSNVEVLKKQIAELGGPSTGL